MKYFTSTAIIRSSWDMLANLLLHDEIKCPLLSAAGSVLLILPGSSLLLTPSGVIVDLVLWVCVYFAEYGLQSAKDQGVPDPGGYTEMAVEGEERVLIFLLAVSPCSKWLCMVYTSGPLSSH